MNTTNTGGPAFPTPRYERGDMYSLGMTLRDYFAAKAMQIMWDSYDKGYCGLNNNDAPNVETIAEGSYLLADAMLKAREA
jgi:hypothetical protein